jgi:hypothetical protein
MKNPGAGNVSRNVNAANATWFGDGAKTKVGAQRRTHARAANSARDFRPGSSDYASPGSPLRRCQGLQKPRNGSAIRFKRRH